MENPEWYQEAIREGQVRKVDPREMKFTFREWLWAIFAYLRFWNKKFRWPYRGLAARKALILMRLRSQRPLTEEEFRKITKEGLYVVDFDNADL